MTHRYRIEPSFNLLLEKFEGKIEWRDIYEGILSSTQAPEFRPGMDAVSDLTSADLDFGYDGARQIVSATTLVPDLMYGRIAVVAARSSQYGIARMLGALTENFNIHSDYRVCSHFSEARSWLGLPEDLAIEL